MYIVVNKRMLKPITFLLVTLLVISCVRKKDKNSDGSVEVIVDLIIKNDNDLILYYKDGSNQWFEDDKAVWAFAKGAEKTQSVSFKINLSTIPNDLRLDIGRNNFIREETLEIKKFVLKYNDNSLVIPEDKFQRYFQGNQYVKFDENTKIYTLAKGPDGKYDPFFEATMEFYPELFKLTY